MLDIKHLGLYWGQGSFSLIESKGSKVLNAISMPFNTPLGPDQPQDVPEGIRYTALIKKALQEGNITTRKVNLSVPAKDLIFRSFVIPWMEPGEVKNVVDFEATKYIPIKLEELSFTYHPVTIVENNQKNLRILFVAIRKDILGRYTGILEHTGLMVQSIEPAPVSLVRVLQKQGYLAQKQCNAIIEIGKMGGKIIIVDRDVVQFVREFQISEDITDISSLTSKLLNDIRVSLNFYVRQNPDGTIKRIITLSTFDLTGLANTLIEEFGTDVKTVTLSDVLKLQEINDIGLFSAFGVAIRSRSAATKNFDLSIKSKDKEYLETDVTKQYRTTGIIAAACIAFIFLSHFLTNQMAVVHYSRLKELETKQGPFKSSDKSQIQKMKDDMQAKLTSYKDVRVNSNITHYLDKIPKLLPTGAWLETFSIQYYLTSPASKGNQRTQKRTISRVSITLDGYIYNVRSNEQFRLVNTFVSNLNEEKDFTDTFDDIDLVSVNQSMIQEHNVAKFRIICK